MGPCSDSRHAACLTSLDPSDLTPQPLANQSCVQRRLHAVRADDRNAAISALYSSTDPQLSRRAERMGMCCVSPSVYATRDGRVVTVPGRCRDRLCPLCQRVRARRVVDQIAGLVRTADAARLITLTRPADGRPLKSVITDLVADYRKFRRSAAWKEHVRGAAAVIEVTRGARGDHWHVHMHILADGTYWPQRDLQRAWSSVVGVDSIVDVRAIYGARAAARYVGGYVAKGTQVARWSHSEIREYAAAMLRQRTVITSGSWHGAKCDDAKEEYVPVDKTDARVGMSVVLAAIEQAEPGVVDAIDDLCDRSWLWRLVMRRPRDAQSDAACDDGESSLRQLHAWIVDLHMRGVCPAKPGDPPRRSQQLTLDMQRWIV